MRLTERDGEFTIMLGSIQLMTSRSTGSEQALATLACDRLRGRKRPHILIGGLGMGFTLRAALAVQGPDARIMVAELVPAVIRWAHGPLAGMYQVPLSEDSRVVVHEGDVRRLIAARPTTFDAILLDVDNGPEGLTHKDNDRLYDLKGLAHARAALKPGGILAVWSSTPNKPFTDRLRAAGFRADQVRVGTSSSGGSRSVIWLATPVEASEAGQREKKDGPRARPPFRPRRNGAARNSRQSPDRG